MNRDRASFVRSTATARLWQRKGRRIRVKLACMMTRGPPRLHSPAFSRPRGVNRDTRRPLGTRRNACGCRRDIFTSLIKTGFDRSVGGAVWALTADPCPRGGRRSDALTTLQRRPIAAAAARRNRDESRALLPPAASTVVALTPPLRHRNRDETATHPEPLLLLAARARVDHGQERKRE